MIIERHTENIITASNFWSEEKCNQFIQQSEETGYQKALIQTDLGPRRVDHIRNNERVIFDDVTLANILWDSVSKIAPQEIGNSEAIGLNERFRFYKYSPGQLFKRHRDQSFIRNDNEASYFTFMIYLNSDYEGGSTTFKNLEIIPETGKCLIFYHYLEHEGSEIQQGVKYILRTDIMYKIKSVKK